MDVIVTLGLLVFIAIIVMASWRTTKILLKLVRASFDKLEDHLFGPRD